MISTSLAVKKIENGSNSIQKIAHDEDIAINHIKYTSFPHLRQTSNIPTSTGQPRTGDNNNMGSSIG